MRPPEFTGGKDLAAAVARGAGRIASMRPPEFTGGKPAKLARWAPAPAPRFNEAAGIHRRKVGRGGGKAWPRPGFNEAAGIHRRKVEYRLRIRTLDNELQ